MPVISSTFNGTDIRATESLAKRAPAVLEAVRIKMDQLNLMLQMHIQTNKLQGQVLNSISGKLSASVHYVPAVIEGDKDIGSVEAGGGAVPYANVQNYGGEKAYPILPVLKKALAFFGPEGPTPRNKVLMRNIISGFGGRFRGFNGRFLKGGKTAAFSAFGKLGGIVVKGVIHPPLEARNFMESSADEMKDEFVAGIQKAAIEGLK